MSHPIRKAVLLAAGRGTRLGGLTANTPKPLLMVDEKPILTHILDALASAGIEEAIVVTGYLASQVEALCADYSAIHLPSITTVRQHELNGTGGAMLAAMHLLEDEAHFAFGWADILMAPANYCRFMNHARSAEYDFMLAVNRVSDPYRGGAVYVDATMRVERLVEKPTRGTSSTNWNNAGLFASTTRLFAYLQRLAPSARGEVELPQAIAAMIDDGLDVRAVEMRGFWSDIGTPEDLEHARKHLKPRI